MELKIYNPTEDGFVKSIEWNHEEIKNEISAKVEHYKGLVYTDEQIKEAKNDRAELNKFVAALESKRKEVKKQCLAPYEEFEKKMKELVAIVQEPIGLIDSQVKEYEEKQKQDKVLAINAYWESIEKPEELEFMKIYDPKWTNASVSMKSIKTAIDDAVIKFKAEMDTLARLPEYSFEAQQTYIRTHDMKQALDEAHRLADMAKKKAEYEAEQARIAEEQARVVEQAKATEQAEPEVKEEAVEEIPTFEPEPVEENFIPTFAKAPEKEWFAVKAKMDAEELAELEQYFATKGIEYKVL